MDPATELLLSDSAISESADIQRPSANAPPPQLLCARCSAELKRHEGIRDPKKSNLRLICIFFAIFLTFLMFIFSVVQMATARQFHGSSILMLFVALWLVVTDVWLGILLYMGRRRYLLGRTSIQIYILCALACSWIIFMIAMLAKNHNACSGWGPTGVSCGMFTTVHIFSWFLIITLFGAVYATYRRAVALHGTALVAVQAPPPPVEAWRLSNIDDGEGFGITI